jgi:hypothetical protein
MVAIAPRNEPYPVSRVAAVLRATLAARLAAWRYAGDRRDLRLDLLRGLAVVAMITDHVGGDQSWLYHLTGGNRFWTSAAEGFVFISGLVYAGVLARQGLRAMLLKALKRAWTLYALTVLLTFASAFAAYKFQLFWAPQVTPATLPDFVVSILTIHRTFYMTDILLMYVLLVFGAALLLFFLAEGYAWQVLAVSWVVWGLWQRWPQQANLPWAIADNNVFQLAPWQLLFVNGLVIGYHRKRLARYFGWIAGRLALVVSGALFAGAILLYRAQLAPLTRLTGHDAPYLDAHLFSKSDERIGRVIVFAIFAIFALSLVTNLWVPLRRALGWLLLPLGQSALWAYGLHLFVIMLTTKAAPHLFGTQGDTAAQNTALQAGGILIVWTIIVLRPRVTTFVQNHIPRLAVAGHGQLQPLAVRAGARNQRG